MRCIPFTSVCDGKTDCLYGSDEALCESYVCPEGARKCANDIQCLDVNMICDGQIDCLDGSDELCTDSCLKSPINDIAIIRRCSEDRAVCVPVERYCDRVPDCPLGSDEADTACTCDDLDMHECMIHESSLCIYKEWISNATTEASYVCDNIMVKEDMDLAHNIQENFSGNIINMSLF